MLKRLLICLVAVCVSGIAGKTATAQEFPIAAGSDSTIAQGGAFDGNNYLRTFVESNFDLSFQFVGKHGALVGSRFYLGAKGVGLMVDFDGTNYLAVWSDPFPLFASDTNGIGDVHGRFISTSGEFIGQPFDIVSGVNAKFGQGRGGLFFKDGKYLLLYMKGGNHTDYLYGQFINTSGNLVGNPIKISSGYARELGVASDSTNYLIAWCEGSGTDEVILGQFLSNTGTLVGSNFEIDVSPNKSDNPLSVGYDGVRFFVLFHDQAASVGNWNIYGRFVTVTGKVTPDRVLVCDSTANPFMPLIAFDGTNYLITWVKNSMGRIIQGRFFCTTGLPVDTPFTVFGMAGAKSPFGGVEGFINKRFVVGASRVDSNLTDGDVYGKFVDPLRLGGGALLGTWQNTSGGTDAQTLYFNSGSLMTAYMMTDTLMTTGYSVDSSVVPHRMAWYDGAGRRVDLAIWEVNGDVLRLKATGGDTTAYPTTFGTETEYPYEATNYTRVTTLTDIVDDNPETPTRFALNQNYPNPFNPSTIISYELTSNGIVSLRVYDVLGRAVATLVNGRQSAGYHSVTFNAGSLPSGVYFYRLESGTYRETRKLLLLK